MKSILTFLKKTLGAVVGLAVLVAIVAWMSGAFREKTPPEKLPHPGRMADANTSTVAVVSAASPIFEEAAGTVQAVRRTAVSSRIMARIDKIEVRAGDYVKAGDVLAVLDSRDLKARVEQANQALQSAGAQLKSAETEYKRQLELVKKNVVTRSEFERAETNYRVAQAQEERAKNLVDEAQVALTYSEIISPVSGRVIDRLAEPGDTAAPGAPLLRLYDPTALQLEAAVRESLASKLKVGDALTARIDALGEVVDARVEEIVPQAEVGSRVFRVKAGLPQRKGLYTGMFGRLIIPIGQREKLLIPAACVETIGQNRFVEVVGADKRITRRLVTLGAPAADGQVEVLSGLAENEKVVAR